MRRVFGPTAKRHHQRGVNEACSDVIEPRRLNLRYVSDQHVDCEPSRP